MSYKPNTIAFTVYLNTGVNNVTGDGTTYQIIYDTKLFDTGTNFTLASGIFTAPIAGNYLLTSLTTISGTPAAVFVTQIVASGKSFRSSRVDSTAAVAQGQSVIVNMAANDTAAVQVIVTGGAKNIGVTGLSGSVYSAYFSGVLIP